MSYKVPKTQVIKAFKKTTCLINHDDHHYMSCSIDQFNN